MKKLKKTVLDALCDGEYLSILKGHGLPVTQKKIDSLFMEVEKAKSLQELQAIDSRVLNFILSELKVSQR